MIEKYLPEDETILSIGLYTVKRSDDTLRVETDKAYYELSNLGDLRSVTYQPNLKRVSKYYSANLETVTQH